MEAGDQARIRHTLDPPLCFACCLRHRLVRASTPELAGSPASPLPPHLGLAGSTANPSQLSLSPFDASSPKTQLRRLGGREPDRLAAPGAVVSIGRLPSTRISCAARRDPPTTQSIRIFARPQRRRWPELPHFQLGRPAVRQPAIQSASLLPQRSCAKEVVFGLDCTTVREGGLRQPGHINLAERGRVGRTSGLPQPRDRALGQHVSLPGCQFQRL